MKTILLILIALVNTVSAKEREITVSGSCKRQAVADRGSITITAEFLNEDLRQATKQVSESYEKIRNAVQKLSLEHAELTTSEYNVIELKEWEKNRNVSKGFRARMGLKVATSQVQRLGEVMSLASRYEAKDVGDLMTYLSEDKIKSENLLCLSEAAENAKTKAEKLATSLNAKIGNVISILESSGSDFARPNPVYMSAGASMKREARDMSPPVVEAGKQDLSLQIQVIFQLL